MHDMADLLDRAPPHDLEAEMCILGSLLIRPDKCEAVRGIIAPEDFYSYANQRIFAHLLALHDEGKHGDVVLLRSRLKQAGDFDDIDGDAYLIELKLAVPTPTNAEQYARSVREKSLLRQAIHAAMHVLRDAYAPNGEPLRIAADNERAFAAIRRAANEANEASLDDRTTIV
jgi:replicative DNA helicase